MLVVGLDQYGGPEQLKLFNLPDPKPKAGEVRVRVSLRRRQSRRRHGAVTALIGHLGNG